MATTKQQLGGLALAAAHDPMKYTAKARKVFADSFMEQVDPDGSLRKKNPKEAERRAKAARSLYYAKLSFKAQQKRKSAKKKEGLQRGSPTASTTRR
jgi:hypothetical protein